MARRNLGMICRYEWTERIDEERLVFFPLKMRESHARDSRGRRKILRQILVDPRDVASPVGPKVSRFLTRV